MATVRYHPGRVFCMFLVAGVGNAIFFNVETFGPTHKKWWLTRTGLAHKPRDQFTRLMPQSIWLGWIWANAKSTKMSTQPCPGLEEFGIGRMGGRNYDDAWKWFVKKLCVLTMRLAISVLDVIKAFGFFKFQVKVLHRGSAYHRPCISCVYG